MNFVGGAADWSGTFRTSPTRAITRPACAAARATRREAPTRPRGRVVRVRRGPERPGHLGEVARRHRVGDPVALGPAGLGARWLEVERPEELVDDRQLAHEVRVVRPRVGGVVPVMELGVRALAQRPEREPHVGVDEQRLQREDDQQRPERAGVKPSTNSGITMHERANAWSTGWRRRPGHPVELGDRVVELVEAPEDRHGVRSAVRPVLQYLGERERLDRLSQNGWAVIPPRTASGTTTCRIPPTSTTTATSPTVVSRLLTAKCTRSVRQPVRSTFCRCTTRSAPWGRRSGRAGRTRRPGSTGSRARPGRARP